MRKNAEDSARVLFWLGANAFLISQITAASDIDNWTPANDLENIVPAAIFALATNISMALLIAEWSGFVRTTERFSKVIELISAPATGPALFAIGSAMLMGTATMGILGAKTKEETASAASFLTAASIFLLGSSLQIFTALKKSESLTQKLAMPNALLFLIGNFFFVASFGLRTHFQVSPTISQVSGAAATACFMVGGITGVCAARRHENKSPDAVENERTGLINSAA